MRAYSSTCSARIIERAFIEPLNDYRQLVMDIAGALALYGEYWANTGAWDALSTPRDAAMNAQRFYKWHDELARATGDASGELRAKGAQLGAYARTVEWYPLLTLLGRLPKRGDLLLAAGELIVISNRTPARQDEAAAANTEANRHIQELLRMATK